MKMFIKKFIFFHHLPESGGPLDTASRELGQAQLSVQQLQRLLDALELQQQAHHDTDVSCVLCMTDLLNILLTLLFLTVFGHSD